MTRVTSAMSSIAIRTGLDEALRRVVDAQSQLASGRRINTYSDAPSDAVSSLRLRALEADWAAYDRQAVDGLGRLNTADGALQSAAALLRRVHELATSAVNGALSQTARDAIAKEVTQLRDELVSLANTSYQGRAVFAGFGDRAVTQVGGAWAYAGDDGAVLRQVSPDVTTRVNVTARDVFGLRPGVTDVFTLLAKVAADVAAGDTAALAADGAALDARADEVRQALATVGALTNRVEAAMDRGRDEVVGLRQQRAELEDVDLADVVLRLSQAEAGYQAALGAAARASLPSLADFLR